MNWWVTWIEPHGSLMRPMRCFMEADNAVAEWMAAHKNRQWTYREALYNFRVINHAELCEAPVYHILSEANRG